ncbi:HNH endonuclease [Microbacterium sp. zg.Y909]|uniref:HNH endonuclease n=1 Tax=Microbacterium sp. zg.Y909 TaxID=2969413 RepID=UPI00214BDE3E|nr:HNH endonuclease signature motif containing protein [Microbacterium sp. zg.Y909]MCR2825555.1 HNH endonuclease [Microbacterium sp. zg.Y909]
MPKTSYLPADEAAARAVDRLGEVLPDLIGVREQMARLQAHEARLLAETDAIVDDWVTDAGLQHRSEAEMPHRIAASEIAAAWRVSDRTVQRQMGDASTLVNDYPATLASLEAGRISSAHVRVIVSNGAIITRPELRAEYEAAILPYAESEAATRVAPIARLRAQWFSETTVDERHHQARLRRSVSITDLDDGMAELVAVLPAALAHGAYDRISQTARIAQTTRASGGDDDALIPADAVQADATPDTRTLNELRADALSDLLLTGAPSSVAIPGGLDSIRANVQVTVPVLTLIGDHVADPFESTTLVGHGPIDAATARTLAAGAPGWDRILTHPISGAVLAVDRYRPSEEMRRYLRTRDQHCRFIACRVPARLCDIDHTIDHARGGPTAVCNLAHFCERHHTAKHHSTWRVEQLGGGVLKWTSPTGRVYIDRPVSEVAFATEPDEFDSPPF